MKQNIQVFVEIINFFVRFLSNFQNSDLFSAFYAVDGSILVRFLSNFQNSDLFSDFYAVDGSILGKNYIKKAILRKICGVLKRNIQVFDQKT